MDSNVEIVVPDQPAMAKVRQCLGRMSGVRFGTSPSKEAARRILAIWLPALEHAAGRQKLRDFFQHSWSAAKDTPAVFVSGTFGIGKTHALLQAVALVSSWAGRRHLDPYVVTDSAALRRLILARKANAEHHLIASVEVDDRTLVVWSCEPRRYEIPVGEIPALASLDAHALQKFELSASGSRIHWPTGDIDLNLDSLRAQVDPAIRRKHELELREEAARYGDAIRQVRMEKGLTQAAIDGLSDRQVRRLEEGHTIPHSATLAKLASAHGMSTNDYLSELASRSARRPRAARSRPRPKRRAS